MIYVIVWRQFILLKIASIKSINYGDHSTKISRNLDDQFHKSNIWENIFFLFLG